MSNKHETGECLTCAPARGGDRTSDAPHRAATALPEKIPNEVLNAAVEAVAKHPKTTSDALRRVTAIMKGVSDEWGMFDVDALEREHEALPHGDLSKTIMQLCGSLRMRRDESRGYQKEIIAHEKRVSTDAKDPPGGYYGVEGVWIDDTLWRCRCVYAVRTARHCALCLTDRPKTPRAAEAPACPAQHRTTRVDPDGTVWCSTCNATLGPALEPMTELREHVVRQVQQNREARKAGKNTVPAIDELESILNIIDNSSHWRGSAEATAPAQDAPPDDYERARAWHESPCPSGGPHPCRDCIASLVTLIDEVRRSAIRNERARAAHETQRRERARAPAEEATAKCPSTNAYNCTRVSCSMPIGHDGYHHGGYGPPWNDDSETLKLRVIAECAAHYVDTNTPTSAIDAAHALRIAVEAWRSSREGQRQMSDDFHITFEEANALVAQYLNEEKYDRHAAGAVIAKVMQERMRRMKRVSPRATPKKGA